jgi:phage virion morphogenesis protein
MGNIVNVEVVNAGLQAKLDALLKAGRDVAMFRTIGSVVANKVRFCFKFGVDPWGSPWAALKLRKGQPLRLTGRLQRSITSRPDNTGVTVGTNVKYGRTHQYGADIFPRPENKRGLLVFPGPKGIVFSKGVKIPQRAFFPQKTPNAPVVLPPSWSVAVIRALRTYFTKVVH